jgi:hypothetical protein
MLSLHQASREELMHLLLENKLPPIQASLFDEESDYSRPAWPGVAPTDLQMLIWIWRHTSKVGRSLIESLISRRIFKRALVVTAGHHRDLTKKLQKIRRFPEAPFEKMIRMEQLMAEKIAQHLDELSAERRNETDAFSAVISKSFLERAKAREILLLVDIPKTDVSNLDELRYLPEADRWKPITEHAKPITIEDSPVWSSLVDSFGEGVGKIRVLVHPDFADTVRSLRRDELEGFLSASATEALP